MRRCGLALTAFGLVIFSTFIAAEASKGLNTNKININSSNNLGTQTNNKYDSEPIQVSPVNIVNASDTIANASNPNEKLSKDSLPVNKVSADVVQLDTNNNTNTKNTAIRSSVSITSDKAFFYKDTNVNFQKKHMVASKRTGAYCVKGDKVIVIVATRNWAKVVYSKNSGEVVTEGWIRSIDL